MADRTFETLADGGGFFEGPRWHDGRWWVSDFYRHTVFAIAPDGTTEEVMTVEAQPSGLGWLPDGSLLVVSMRDHKVLRRAPDGTVSVHADIAEHCGGLANDIVVTPEGHA
jgi:sugar lactone lactonase YvrE